MGQQPSAPNPQRGVFEKFEFKEFDMDGDYMNNTVVHNRNRSKFIPYLRERDNIGCLVNMGRNQSQNVSELSLKEKIEIAASKKRKDPMK